MCDNRTDIRCTASHCDIAGPGAPGNSNSCRVCWLRLGRPSVKPPSLLRRAWNYAKAVYWHRRRGKKIVSEAVARKRLDMCESCEWFNAKTRVCSQPGCGCNMDKKVTWAEQKCPIGRWTSES